MAAYYFVHKGGPSVLQGWGLSLEMSPELSVAGLKSRKILLETLERFQRQRLRNF